MSPGPGPTQTWGRAIAAAAVLGDATGALARIAGETGEVARTQVATWQAQARGERARSIAATAAAVRAAVPAGADRVDRSWSEAALAADDERARPAWEQRRGDQVGVWWCRRVAGAWVAVPAEDAAASTDELARWPAARITSAMRRLTLAMVAHVTLEAGDAALARLAASMVDGAVMVELARRLRADGELRAALGPARAAAEWIRGIDVRTDLGLGATMLAPHLRGDAGRQVELLLPIGTVVEGDGPEPNRSPGVGVSADAGSSRRGSTLRGPEVGWPAIRGLLGSAPEQP